MMVQLAPPSVVFTNNPSAPAANPLLLSIIQLQAKSDARSLLTNVTSVQVPAQEVHFISFEFPANSTTA